jgi:hypothetical protein
MASNGMRAKLLVCTFIAVSGLFVKRNCPGRFVCVVVHSYQDHVCGPSFVNITWFASWICIRLVIDMDAVRYA